MKLNNRFIFGILSLLLAAVIAFVALPTIARQTNGKEEIVRITQPVLKGEQISSENAEVVEVPQYILSKGTGDTLLQTGHKGVAMNRFNLFVAMINANKHM